MGGMNQVLLSLSSVKSFRDYSVKLVVVLVSDDEFVTYLNETYSEVSVCGLNVKAGSALQQLAPLMFQTIRDEYQEELQATLQAQMVQANDVDIEFND